MATSNRVWGAKARYWGLAVVAVVALVAAGMGDDGEAKAAAVAGGMEFVCYRDGKELRRLPALQIEQRANTVTGGEHWTVVMPGRGTLKHYADPMEVCGPQWPQQAVD